MMTTHFYDFLSKTKHATQPFMYRILTAAKFHCPLAVADGT